MSKNLHILQNQFVLQVNALLFLELSFAYNVFNMLSYHVWKAFVVNLEFLIYIFLHMIQW